MDQLMRDGNMVTFEDVGKGAPPILLIHDPDFPPVSMGSQLAKFCDRHRVVLPDLRARSESRSPPSQNPIGDAAENLAWLCYELGVYRPVAIGDRLGGLIALELASGYPDLLAAIVTLAAPLESATFRGADTSQEHREVRSRARPHPLPWLRIEAQLPATSTVETFGNQNPEVVIRCVSVGDLQPGEAMSRVNAMVDAFVSEL